MGGIIRNKKQFLITVFTLGTILYWGLVLPFVWIFAKSRLGYKAWLIIIICAIALFLLLALIAIYFLRKYNQRLASEKPVQEEFQFTTRTTTTQRRDITTRIPLTPPPVCEVPVDKKILQDAVTQTDRNPSSEIYRTSLIMDVGPRSPSSEGSGISGWYYPTMAEYYKDKTVKLKEKLNKQERPEKDWAQRNSGYVINVDSDELVYAVGDTNRVFLKSEQVYRNLELQGPSK